jgi:hypothetical protein
MMLRCRWWLGGVLATGLSAQTGTWSQLPAPTTPAFSTGELNPVSMVYDTARQVSVMVGLGARGGQGFVDTWEYDGTDWSLRHSLPLIAGGNLFWSNMVWNERRQRAQIVTATTSNVYLSEWDGVAWTPIGSALLGLSQSYRLARDPQRDLLVLLIGTFQPPCALWNGSSWSAAPSRPPGTGPMAFDPVRREVICRDIDVIYSFDGANWQRLPAIGPTLRPTMVTDPWLPRVLLNDPSSTWEWNGSDWQRILRIGPAPLFWDMRAYCFDEARGGLLMFTGVPGYSTWIHRELPGAPAQFTAVGSRCTGPSGSPALLAVNRSTPRLGRTLELQVQGLAPTALAIGVWGFDTARWQGQPLPLDLGAFGAPGCDLRVAPLCSVLLPTAAGTAHWSIAIPPQVPLIGVSFDVQAFGLVSGSFTASNAGHALIGPR